MKIVVVSLALIFFTGSECRFLWMKDEPKPEPGKLEAAVNNMKILGEYYVDYLENTEIGKELRLKEEIAPMRNAINDFETTLTKFFKYFIEEMDKELTENYPVFRTKVVPALIDFQQRWDKHIEELEKEIVKMSHKLLFSVRKNVQHFLDSLSDSASRGRDKLRTEVESLRATLLPYVDELHKELETAKKGMYDDVEEAMKNINQGVDEMKDYIKPYFEKLKSNANPYEEELQKHLLKLLDDIKEALSKEAK